jgi:hypothetical protein
MAFFHSNEHAFARSTDLTIGFKEKFNVDPFAFDGGDLTREVQWCIGWRRAAELD